MALLPKRNLAEMSSSSVEEERQNCNIDWRAQKSSFGEQVAHFYMNEDMSDVEFVFDRQDKITV